MRYSVYKNTNLNFVSQIPAHWQIKRNRFILSESKNISETGEGALLCLSQYTGITLKKDTDKQGMFRAESLVGYRIVEPDNIVMNIMLAWNGSTAHSRYKGLISPAYAVFTINDRKINPRFLHYFFRLPETCGYFKAYSTGIINSRLRLYPQNFLQLYSFIPPREEQDQIVRFLDWQTSQINKLIHGYQKQIKLLEEQLYSIISITVTKGINKKHFKNSNLDWMGNIPSDWKLIRIKNNYTLQNGISESGDFFSEGFPFVNYSDVYKNRILPDKVTGVANSTQQQRNLYSVKEGDIFFTRTSETIDEVGFASVCLKDMNDTIYSGFLIRARPKNDMILTKFASYYLRGQHVRNFFTKEMNLVTRASLGQNLLKSLYIAVPPKEEQVQIIDYLEKTEEKNKKTIQDIQHQIDLLREYRTRLISDVVTGQIDVRGINIPDYEPEEDVSDEAEADEELPDEEESDE